MHDDGLKMTYSYGRYGEVYGILGLSGEGILKIYEGDRHIQDHFNKGRTMYRYELDMTDEEITRLLMFYEDFAGREISLSPGKKSREIVTSNDYHILTSNCTTVVSAALEAAYGDKLPWVIGDQFIPAFMNNVLKSSKLVVNTYVRRPKK